MIVVKSKHLVLKVGEVDITVSGVDIIVKEQRDDACDKTIRRHCLPIITSSSTTTATMAPDPLQVQDGNLDTSKK